MKRKELTQEELKKTLDYNPDTGVFTWLIPPNLNAGSGEVAGILCPYGYIHIYYKRKHYLAHRLAFFYMEGYFPEYDVDHKNGIKNDNRWSNLRHASRSCNLQNQKISSTNISGFPGVYWNKGTRKWAVDIGINKKHIHLGYYDSALEAALARFTAEVWDDGWTCNYRSELVRAIKKVWPEFVAV